ncbi:MAG: hypothetical protein VKJ24_15245 [Synechococcales bacterium]|nr:hypothetical protein [Synechococcales bacterium]
MAYSDFTLETAIEQFGLTIRETSALIQSQPVSPTDLLVAILERELPWAIAVGSEIARYSGIISQVLLDVRALKQQQISVFAGKEFNVDPDRQLNGYCDFLISLSPIQSVIQAPVIIIAEAKRGILENGLGQCVAAMVAAQQFNQNHRLTIPAIYGSVTNGSNWKFLKLSGTELIIDITEYEITNIDRIVGILFAMTT